MKIHDPKTSTITRRNRANKARGLKFESKVAEFLDMDQVPYSGSNIKWGYGDVKDSIWLCECKTITPDSKGRILIKTSWLDKNRERAIPLGLMPFLAFTAVRSPLNFVMLEEEEVNKVGIDCDIVMKIKKVNVKSVNIFIDTKAEYLKNITSGKIMMIMFDSKTYAVMSIEKWKCLIEEKGLKGRRQSY
jgi:hypothetical protein